MVEQDSFAPGAGAFDRYASFRCIKYVLVPQLQLSMQDPGTQLYVPEQREIINTTYVSKTENWNTLDGKMTDRNVS